MSFNVDYIINLRDNASVKIKELNRLSKDTNTGFAKLGSSIGGLLAGAGIVVGIKKIADLGIEMEQTRVAFSTFLGDAGKANALIGELNEFANVTPFDNAEIIKSSRLLLSAGVGAEDMTKQLKSIGDVAAGANVPITELSAIFAKATNKGKLQAEELNQFAERGIPLLDELAKKFGVSKEEVLDMGSKGKITSQVMNEAFTSMTSEGGIFFDLMKKQSETTGGKISTLVGQLQLIGIQIGEKLLPIISRMVDGFMRFISFVQANAETFKVVGGAILGLVAAVGIIIGAIKVWTLVQNILNFVLTANPIGLVIVAIGALVGAILVVKEQAGSWAALWGAIMENIQAKVDVLKFGLLLNWSFIKDAFLTMVDGMVLAWKMGMNLIGQLSDDQFAKDKARIQEEGRLRKVELMKNLKGFVESTAKVQKGLIFKTETGDKKSALSGAGGIIPTGPQVGGSPAGGGLGKGLDSGIDSVTSSAPKTFNINIENLVKEFQIQTNNIKEGAEETKNMILQTLIGAVNDVSIIDK
jgi:tape measure domain-containing protein